MGGKDTGANSNWASVGMGNLGKHGEETFQVQKVKGAFQYALSLARILQEDGRFTYSIIGMFKKIGIIFTEEQGGVKKYKGVQVVICDTSSTMND